jgi:GxxExxY protein
LRKKRKKKTGNLTTANPVVMEIDILTGIVIDRCIKIHSKIGPGCFEKIYEEIMYYELTKLGFKVERQVLLPIKYEELKIDNAYKLDLLVEDMLVLELKSLYPLHPVYYKQIRTHLTLLNLKYGMLLNFKVELMKYGIHRVFNNHGRLRR